MSQATEAKQQPRNSNFISGDDAASGATIHELMRGKLPGFLSADGENRIAAREEQARGYAIRRSWETLEAFRLRRRGFKSLVKAETPTVGMAPDRARGEYQRLLRSPNLAEHAKQLNELEGILGLPIRDYGDAAAKEAQAGKIDPEVVAAFEALRDRYKRADDRVRLVGSLGDKRLLQIIMERDKVPAVREAAEARLGIILAGGPTQSAAPANVESLNDTPPEE